MIYLSELGLNKELKLPEALFLLTKAKQDIISKKKNAVRDF